MAPSVIWKYPVTINDYFSLNLPEGAQILKVDSQYDMVFMWVFVNPDAPPEIRNFRFAGTGHTIKESWDQLKHIDTFQLHDGNLIFHIFEIIG